MVQPRHARARHDPFVLVRWIAVLTVLCVITAAVWVALWVALEPSH